jgi:ClpP class serine protease
LAELSKKRRKLVFVLETPGGYAEVARRISDALRHHYDEVDFLIPSHAMSAGTILVMSGDAIHMDYHSVLGPIDPQSRSRKMLSQ